MAKTKVLISFAVTAKLICVFVFAYAKNRFSHDEAQLVYILVRICTFCQDVSVWKQEMYPDFTSDIRHAVYIGLEPSNCDDSIVGTIFPLFPVKYRSDLVPGEVSLINIIVFLMDRKVYDL